MPEVDCSDTATLASAGAGPALLADAACPPDNRRGIRCCGDRRLHFPAGVFGQQLANDTFIGAGGIEVHLASIVRHCRRDFNPGFDSQLDSTQGAAYSAVRGDASLGQQRILRSILRHAVHSPNQKRTESTSGTIPSWHGTEPGHHGCHDPRGIRGANFFPAVRSDSRRPVPG